MQFSENIGQFYLGRSSNNAKKPILYEAKDLSTHAVIIGMTGSGKTGLGVCLIEEALLDYIPVIAVDPKGDMGNLLLTFPELNPASFAPYISNNEAKQSGETIGKLAEDKATLWKTGLKNSGQSKERIKKLRERAGFNLYTPGATYGRPISLLKSLAPPHQEIKSQRDVYQERIASATTGILSLLGHANAPLSRPYILVSKLLEHYWDNAQSVSLENLIISIQTPPFDRIGVMDLETIYPEKDRLSLAMQLNALLSSPGFKAWTKGDSLDTDKLLFKNGKPQLSVMNIAHLSNDERMFFMTMLLNDILSWMRTQSGTGSLRAVLYIDEIFGYMPPTANPASKTLLLTLLKQARAYGLGLVLSTQNPVDLDYKGLSNAGTWFIGKLQTEQDRNRVTSGLLSATENGMNKAELDECFDMLGKRTFLMHNIHENSPEIFNTRWAMSYLAGPLTKNQIQDLTEVHRHENLEDKKVALEKSHAELNLCEHFSIPAGITQYTLPTEHVVTDYSSLIYEANLVALCELSYTDKKLNTPLTKTLILSTPFTDSAIPVDWRDALELTVDSELIAMSPPKEGKLITPPSAAMKKAFYNDWKKSLLSWARQTKYLDVFYYAPAKIISSPTEEEDTFKQRLNLTIHELRDEKVKTLREKIDKKLDMLNNKLVKAQQKVDKETEQSSSKNMDAIIGIGSAVLGAFLGRKTISKTNVNSLGTAMRKVSRAYDEKKDIDRAKESFSLIEDDINLLEKKFLAESEQISNEFSLDNLELETIRIYPKANDIQVKLFGLGWQPKITKEGKLRKV